MACNGHARERPKVCWAMSACLLSHAGVKGAMVRFGPHLGPTKRLKMGLTLGLDLIVDRINTYKKRIENKIKHVIKT